MDINLRKVLIIGVLLSFLANTFGPLPVYAQDFVLPTPGTMVSLSPAFAPPILKGIKVHPDNPFRFDFILDKGDSQLSNDALKNESSTLIKYFLASLTIPEKDLWVNLSPYEKNRIVPESFGQTEMGRDLLAEDYILKQITASLIYPEGEVGKRFWKRIYEEAALRFGTTNIPVNTFNKVWIVPEKAVVYENAKAGTAYVVESKLKVMLEQDYLSLQKHEGISALPQVKDTNQLGSQIVREIVIPQLTKEVNEDKNFSQLRQVYNSLILATWYKKKIKDSILEQVYANKNKVAGVNIDDPQEKESIYHRYLQAFKKGAYNYIKEEIDPVSQQTVPRKYFSGGFGFESIGETIKFSDRAQLSDFMKNLKLVGRAVKRYMILTAAFNFIPYLSVPSSQDFESYSSSRPAFNIQLTRPLNDKNDLKGYFNSQEYMRLSFESELFLKKEAESVQEKVRWFLSQTDSEKSMKNTASYLRDLRVAILVHMQNKYHYLDSNSFYSLLEDSMDFRINNTYNAYFDSIGKEFLKMFDTRSIVFTLAHEMGHKVFNNWAWSFAYNLFDAFLIPAGPKFSPSGARYEFEADIYAHAVLTDLYPQGRSELIVSDISKKVQENYKIPIGGRIFAWLLFNPLVNADHDLEPHTRVRNFIEDLNTEITRRNMTIDWIKAASVVNQIKLNDSFFTIPNYYFDSYVNRFLSLYLGINELPQESEPSVEEGLKARLRYQQIIKRSLEEFDRLKNIPNHAMNAISYDAVMKGGKGERRNDKAMLNVLKNVSSAPQIITTVVRALLRA